MRHAGDGALDTESGLTQATVSNGSNGGAIENRDILGPVNRIQGADRIQGGMDQV